MANLPGTNTWNNPDWGYNPNQGIGKAFGAGQLGSGLAGLFGHQRNPYDEANKYIGQIPGATQGFYDPYMQAGQGALGSLGSQYGDLLGNPGGKLNDIGSHYQQSPGFQFALQQALAGSGRAAAAGGMAGSPQHEQENMGISTGMANQDYNNWLGQATGLYGQGLSGEQGLAGLGFQGANSQANNVANALAQQGNNAGAGADWKNQNNSRSWGNIFGGLGGLFF